MCPVDPNTRRARSATSTRLSCKGKIKRAGRSDKGGKIFVLPNLKSGAAALNNIQLNSMLAGEDQPRPEADSYPISNPYHGVLAYRK